MDNIPLRHINSNQKEPELHDSFSIRDVESLLNGNDMVQELHRHDFFYILILKNGSGSHEIDFQPYGISENSVFFMRPGQVHELVVKEGSTGYLMQFRTDFYSPLDRLSGLLLRRAASCNYRNPDAARFQKLHEMAHQIFLEFNGKEERYQDVIRAAMGIFFIALTRADSIPSGRENLHMQEQLEKFIELLEVHVFEHKKAAQYAAMLHLSAYQLNAATKATLGKTASEVINEHIILEAKRCLRATSKQVNQVAYRLGYEDVSYFIRFFKQHTGYSPAAFRQNLK
jgi:AraC family transcriptional activator of pobA